MSRLIVSEPRPTDPVCPVCGEIVRRSNPKEADSPTVCPNFHESDRAPIAYQQWLAEIAMGGEEDGEENG